MSLSECILIDGTLPFNRVKEFIRKCDNFIIDSKEVPWEGGADFVKGLSLALKQFKEFIKKEAGEDLV